MGLYPETSYKREGDSLIVTTTEPGLVREETFVLASAMEERTECFCCSCGDRGADAACRNHGFMGTRPCEVHNMPGVAWEDTGEMPESVQAARLARA